MKPVYINLDDAWDPAQLQTLGIRTIDARPQGPHHRYIAPERIIQQSIQTLSASSSTAPAISTTSPHGG